MSTKPARKPDERRESTGTASLGHGRLVRLQFRGHVKRADITEAMAQAGSLASARVLVDLLAVDDYDAEVRDLIVAWMRQSKPTKVALVLGKPLWRMVVRAMSMASSVPMHAVDSVAEAEAWLAH